MNQQLRANKERQMEELRQRKEEEAAALARKAALDDEARRAEERRLQAKLEKMLKLQEQALGVITSGPKPPPPHTPRSGGRAVGRAAAGRAAAKAGATVRTAPSPRARSLLYDESLRVKTSCGPTTRAEHEL
eukprot:6807598-Prymnesium_polylepis.1